MEVGIEAETRRDDHSFQDTFRFLSTHQLTTTSAKDDSGAVAYRYTP